MVFRAANPNVVGQLNAEEVIAGVNAEHSTESVFEIILGGLAHITQILLILDPYPPCSLKIHSINLKPRAPKHPRSPHAVSIDNTTSIIPALIINLILNIKVDSANNAVR